MKDSYDGFSKDIIFNNFNGVKIKLQYSSGGLHILQGVESFKSDNEYVIIEKDFASLYPNLYINHNFNSPKKLDGPPKLPFKNVLNAKEILSCVSLFSGT